MLILSNFKDYYDHITAFGVDKTIIYRRETKGLQIKAVGLQDLPPSEDFRTKAREYQCFYNIVGFCGKLYPVIKVERKDYNTKDAIPEIFYLYTIEQVEAFLKSFGIKETKKVTRWRGFNTDLRRPNSLQDFFDAKDYKCLTKVFSDYRIPCFVWYDTKGYINLTLEIKTNPRLKDYGFVKIKHPVDAFQELMLYVSGVIGSESKEVIEISDKDKAKAHAHDGKYSFRTPPQNKPKRPKNK